MGYTDPTGYYLIEPGDAPASGNTHSTPNPTKSDRDRHADRGDDYLRDNPYKYGNGQGQMNDLAASGIKQKIRGYDRKNLDLILQVSADGSTVYGTVHIGCQGGAYCGSVAKDFEALNGSAIAQNGKEYVLDIDVVLIDGNLNADINVVVGGNGKNIIDANGNKGIIMGSSQPGHVYLKLSTNRHLIDSVTIHLPSDDPAFRGGVGGHPAHEFGHALGLDHAQPGSGSTMSYDKIRGGLLGDEIRNLAFEYSN